MHLITSSTKLFILFFFSNAAVAQIAYEPSSGSMDNKEPVGFYRSFISESDPIYNGCEYSRYPHYINSGIPFFTVDTMTAGSVVYNGILYKDVLMMYDMIIDELITKDLGGKNMIKLVKQKVDSFYLNGGKFISIRNNDRTMPRGYYQVLLQGKIELLKKEIKYIEDKVQFNEALEKNILAKIAYYIKYNGEYFPVSNARSLISIVQDGKEKINKFLEDNKNPNRKTDPGVLLFDLINYYNQSTE